ncbi:MAG: tetratricopeptide repeat protein [Leadbetterella sp.]
MSKDLLRKLCLNVLLIHLSFLGWGQTIVKDKEYYIDTATRYYHQTSEEYRIYLDSALALHPNDAELWRGKATSYFKAGQLMSAIKCINKAVELDTLTWMGYRGFMKCIFMKDYRNAIIDLKYMYQKRPLEHQMDHSYPFWIGLSYLKLKQLDSADHYLSLPTNQSLTAGKESVHYVNWFYKGLTKYFQEDFEKASKFLENATIENSHFPDAQFYLAKTLLKQKKRSKKIII